MALNYSHRPVFTAHISEDNLVSPMRIVNGYFLEGIPEKNGEGYLKPWHVSRGEVDDRNFNIGRHRGDHCSPSEAASKDIVDLLPSDPFGMDIQSTFTAITGWLEDLEVDCGGYVRSNSGMGNQENYGLFSGWNFIWNNAVKFQQFPGGVHFNDKLNMGLQTFQSYRPVHEKLCADTQSLTDGVSSDEKSNLVSKVTHCGGERDMQGPLDPYEFEFRPASNMGETVGFNEGGTSCRSELQFEEKVEGAANSEGVPHEALAFALGYLGVKDLLSVERVCRSLCSTVRDDPLLWMNIHIDQPLNERITDDILLQLASRAQSNLQCLSLVECPRVTDDGLRRVLETNPRLDKLCVPGCTRLSIEGIVNNIKIHNSNKDVRGIKQLRIGGLYGVTDKHFEELNMLLGADGHTRAACHKPHFYRRGNFYLPCADDRSIDIEMCRRCEKFRLVYDCPAEGCQNKDKGAQVCRACILCIARCAQCGRCINDTEYEETFCLELLCSECFKQLLKYQDRLDKKVDPCGDLHEPSCSYDVHG